ncbi:DEKNAAC103759 [Brettanomyces naardenensis]|uniref:Aspartate aminotransferase n=1 Tax=Brettanomyces naardenensis TaxID=13370 RepID=A0A448YPC1_BRENA|nr:DEKNAAC103759 [Brettanomyces naardenensis]
MSGFYSSNIPQLPPDPLFGIKARFALDTHPNKVDLGVGAYRDENGKPWILPSVRLAENLLQHSADFNHEYLPITGLKSLTEEAAKVILGDESRAIKEKRVVSIQSLSGTGSLHLAAKLIALFFKPADGTTESPVIYISDPSWANHIQVFETCGLKTARYPYLDAEKKVIRINEYVKTIEEAPRGSVFLLHATAHNPTGIDPTPEQWKIVLKAISDNGHLPLFDCAYQGFTTGSLSEDAWALRHAIDTEGYKFPGVLVCQSFAKNCGMYGERVGAFHVILPVHDEALNSAVLSQLSKVIRSEISNPPGYGAKIVSLILTTPELKKQWEQDLITMSSRIFGMRKALVAELERLGTPGSWKHIVEQKGMFSFTGLTPEQTDKLAEDYGIYMTRNGRASIAGLNGGNVKYVAKGIDGVVRKH